jgi:hypothetical protein
VKRWWHDDLLLLAVALAVATVAGIVAVLWLT